MQRALVMAELEKSFYAGAHTCLRLITGRQEAGGVGQDHVETFLLIQR